jgi:hypothetical protein
VIEVGSKQMAAARAGRSGPAVEESVNLVVVRGECATAPEVRELDSGRRLASVAVRVRPGGGRTTWVPVTVWEPPAWVEDLAEGDDLVVVGSVRRTFFAARPGGRGQRVDVEAGFVGRPGRKRSRDAARRRVADALEALWP